MQLKISTSAVLMFDKNHTRQIFYRFIICVEKISELKRVILENVVSESNLSQNRSVHNCIDLLTNSKI